MCLCRGRKLDNQCLRKTQARTTRSGLDTVLFNVQGTATKAVYYTISYGKGSNI